MSYLQFRLTPPPLYQENLPLLHWKENWPVVRVLARISKKLVQNSNSKYSARPDLAILSYFKSLYQLHFTAFCVKKGNLHLSHVLEDKLLGKYVVITLKKSILTWPNRCVSGNCLSKRQVGRVLAKSLPVVDHLYLLDLFTGVLLAADNFQHTDTGQ